jgi:hypothetical protein
MEVQEIYSHIDVERKNGKSDAQILPELKAKVGSLFAVNELLNFLNKYPTPERQARYKSMNVALCWIVGLITAIRVSGRVLAVVMSASTIKPAVLPIILIFAAVELYLGIMILRKISKFEQSGYRLVLFLGLLMTAGILESLLSGPNQDHSVWSVGFMVISGLLWASGMVINYKLIKNLWPHLTLHGSLKTESSSAK